MSAATAARWSLTSRRHWLRSIASAALRMLRPASVGSMSSAQKIATCSTSGREGKFLLALRRQAFEARHAFGDRMKFLLVAGVDRYFWSAVKLGLVKRADFEDHGR